MCAFEKSWGKQERKALSLEREDGRVVKIDQVSFLCLGMGLHVDLDAWPRTGNSNIQQRTRGSRVAGPCLAGWLS